MLQFISRRRLFGTLKTTSNNAASDTYRDQVVAICQQSYQQASHRSSIKVDTEIDSQLEDPRILSDLNVKYQALMKVSTLTGRQFTHVELNNANSIMDVLRILNTPARGVDLVADRLMTVQDKLSKFKLLPLNMHWSPSKRDLIIQMDQQ